jgi:hypothetical protein
MDFCFTQQTAFSVALSVIDDASKPPQLVESGEPNEFIEDAQKSSSSDRFLEARQIADLAHPVNPGSIGHPELCPRPCLYFPVGRCSNGVDCNFCHLPHPKRPSHLDKRHRSMLKEMSFQDCLSLMLPILRQKIQLMEVSSDIRDVLDVLEASAHVPATAPPGTQALQTALRAMTLRSLLTALHRQASPQSSPEQVAIESLLQQLRCLDEPQGSQPLVP